MQSEQLAGTSAVDSVAAVVGLPTAYEAALDQLRLRVAARTGHWQPSLVADWPAGFEQIRWVRGI